MTLYEFVTQTLKWTGARAGICWEVNGTTYWNDLQGIDWDLTIVEDVVLQDPEFVIVNSPMARVCHPDAIIIIEKKK